ncbi:MAG: restriction endonuclease [Bacteroidetes bacterium]|nr:MAG: restriction endonuclease [Bacteroidota bacterium]
MTQIPAVHITKASGEHVLYAPEKLRHSLAKAGAIPPMIEEIVLEVEAYLKPGMSTGKIYQKAFALLKQRSRSTAAKYKLKRAVAELGPTGYPFERFIGEILRMHGYEIQVGQYIQGQCVSHEVDVLGDIPNRRIAVECKFGNRRDKKIDIKVALYVHSRVRDLARAWRKTAGFEQREIQGWIVTNGSFTGDALQYGVCSGMHMVSWDHPKRGNLKDLIEIPALYPITSLVTLTKAEKQQLVDQGFILCRNLLDQLSVLDELSLSNARRRKLLIELEELCPPV